MNVLGLFDGLSSGQIALGRAGIEYDNYFASEVDKGAIAVTQHNYPKTIQIGDVASVRGADLPKVDLLIGGSPCTGFSYAGKQLNFEDPGSKLFFEFARLVRECSPKYWLLENVVMKKEYENVISETLGVEPTLIDSALLSAQTRKRLYWANFSISQPEDRGVRLADILDDTGDGLLNKAQIVGRRLNDRGVREDNNKSIAIVQCLEVRDSKLDKSGCLTTVPKDNVLSSLPPGRYNDVFGRNLPFRYYTQGECCRLQTVPENYFGGVVSKTAAIKMLGNGWTVDVIAHIFHGIPKET